MNLTAFTFRYRLVTTLCLLSWILFGSMAWGWLPRREDPDIPFRNGQVMALWPGADAQQMEERVAQRVEASLLEVDGVRKVETLVRPGVAIMRLEARDEVRNLQHFWRLVREKLHDLQGLPPDMSPLQINDHFGDTSALIYALVPKAELDSPSLRALEDWAQTLADRARRLSEVAEAHMLGEQPEVLEVELDSQKLRQYRVNPDEIAAVLRANQLLERASGTLESGDLRIPTASDSQLWGPEDLAVLPLPRSDRPDLRIGDLARVRLRLLDPPSFEVRVQNRPAVAVNLTMRKGSDILELGKKLEALVGDLQQELPPDLEIIKVNDIPTSVKGRIGEFQNNLRDGVVLILLITWLFMGWRSALLVGVMLPATILGTAFVLLVTGKDLQQMSITALIIALGLVVDNSVVVVDNIEHLMAQGVAAEQASREGAEKLRLPLLTSNLTTVAAFLPLAAIPGGKGDFIQDLGWVTSIATLVSLLLNLTLLPLLCEAFLKPLNREGTGRFARWLERLAERIQALAELALRRPARVTAGALLASLLAVASLPLLGIQFFPSAQRNQCNLEVWCADGGSLAQLRQAVEGLEGWLLQQPEVTTEVAYLGRGGPRFYYNINPEPPLPNYAQIVVNTRSVQATEELLARLRQNLSLFPGCRVIPRKLEQGPPVGAPLQLKLQGADWETLRASAEQMVQHLQAQPGVLAAYQDFGQSVLGFEINWDTQRLAQLGLTPTQASQASRILAEGLTVMELRQGQRQRWVELRSREQADQLWLFGVGGEGAPLQQLSRPRVRAFPQRLSRLNRVLTCNIYAHVDGSRLPSAILGEVFPELQKLAPPSCRLQFAGEQEELDKSLRELSIVFTATVLGQLLVVAWEFNHLRMAATVLGAIPLSLVGGIAGLALSGHPFSFTAFLGLITLGGVVTNHAIMFFEYARAEQGKGMELVEALLRAGKLRLRPILLTVLLSIGGLLPLAIGGGNLWPPMAWTLIAGLIYSVPLALIVVPSLYSTLSRWGKTTPG